MLIRPYWVWGLVTISFPNSWAEEKPLDLPGCLDAAFTNNRELVQARKEIEQVEANHIVVRSRFHPQIDLLANYDALRSEVDGKTSDSVASQLRFTQRLFEFGPHAAQEVSFRENLRKAVFGYEDRVYDVFSEVWENFHVTVLQDEQVAIREESKHGFQQTLERQRARYERNLATEEDVLNAELNVLNEELAISNIKREQLNRKMELLRLIGRPIGIHLRLDGELELFALEPDQAVDLALENSVQIALLDREVREQQRVVRETNWDYAPDLSVEAGVEDGRTSAGVSVDREGETWGVNMRSGVEMQERKVPLDPAEEDARWFANVEARIPIFQGGSRLGEERREAAKLQQKSVSLDDARATVELGVRQAYQKMLESKEQQAIQEKQVRIARRRLEINQTLKDKGEADDSLLEQVRLQFFQAQDRLFQVQISQIERQAALRRLMGRFD